MNTTSPSYVAAGPIADAYSELVAQGHFREDPVQRRLIRELDMLLVELGKSRLASKSSALGWLFGKSSKREDRAQGLYIWGGVGRGKSYLMDLFFEHVPNDRKRRAHFNDFMADVHERIHRFRSNQDERTDNDKDPVVLAADEIAEAAKVLCFDEFTVTDIADAMILGRLFEQLFKRGITLIATSNVEPGKLYKDGLNRGIFLPFIDILIKNVRVFHLDAETDYRLEKLTQAPVYLTPINSKTQNSMEVLWQSMTAGQTVEPVEIELRGRKLHVPGAANGVARFTFSQLCEEPKGAADFLALCREFHTLFIDKIRVIGDGERNVAKRFILLVDTLYDNRIRLVATSEAEPSQLYSASWGTEAFEIERTVSRLIEMQSEDYLAGEQ